MPPFVEWLMGFPQGWVDDVDISRTQKLRCLGNAVVPAQAALAWRLLNQAAVPGNPKRGSVI